MIGLTPSVSFLRRSIYFKESPHPLTTQSEGFSATLTLRSVAAEISLSKQALDIYGKVRNFLDRGAEVDDIMNIIEEDIDTQPKEENKELWDFMNNHKAVFQNDIFNCMTEYEFIDYCRERYPDINWGQEVVERYWIM